MKVTVEIDCTPEELLKNWMTLGGLAQEQFRKLMTAAASGTKA